MPHLIVEYSANLEDDIDLGALLGALHAAAIKTGVFPLGGCRTRAARRDHYVIADDSPENAFVHVIARIGAGRGVETRRRAGDAIFETLTDQLSGVYDRRPIGISFEMVEIDPDATWKKNNLHEAVESRGARAETGAV